MSDTKNLNYWYDGQLRRYLAQIIRVFSHFEVRENTASGYNYNRVLCRYGDPQRQAMMLARGQSENKINSLPFISVGIQSMQYNQSRTQDPFFQRTDQVAERKYDVTTGQYTAEQGNLYSVDRYMPVPYDMTVQVDVFSNNTDTKMQILEQIFVLFNPSLQLTTNSNPLDWGNVWELSIGDINWTSRPIPSGTEDIIDVATMTFTVPIWISPPAKVRRQTIIQRILADIQTVNSISDLNFSDDYYDFFDGLQESTLVVTPGNYRLSVDSGYVQLIGTNGQPVAWKDLLEQHGEIKEGSLIRLNLTDDPNNDDQSATGRIQPHSDETKLTFLLDADTLPSNTLAAVDAIINPKSSSPGDDLPAAATGQRYLIVESVSTDYAAWNLNASDGDIIEYNGSDWVVSFNSDSATDTEYLENDTTGDQWKWTGSQWISSHRGTYREGFWRLVL